MDTWILLAAGLVYAAVFLAVGMRYPVFALAAVFAFAPFPGDVSGGGPLKFSLAEINLILSLAILLIKGKRPRGGAVVWGSLGYLAVCLLCSCLSWRATTLVALVQMTLYLLMAVVVFGTLAKSDGDCLTCFHAYVVGATFLAASVIVFRTPFIYGIHKNNCGSSIAAGFLIVLELCFHARKGKARFIYLGLAGILGVGLMITLSRGAWLSVIVGSMTIFALRRQFALMLRATIAVGILAAICWTLLPQESKDYVSGVHADDWNIKLRYESKDFAMNYFTSHPIFGVGVGLRKEYDATNVVFMVLAETGILGLASFVVMEGTVLLVLWKAQRKMPRTALSFSVLAIAGALIMGKLAHGMVDHYWVRGALTAGWCTVGMAARVARDERGRLRLAAQLRRMRFAQPLPTAEASLS